MGRRYLLKDEAEAALRRGKAVECFLGPCEREGQLGIRHIALSLVDGAFVASLYETADFGSASFLDLYAFGPLDPNLEQGDADSVLSFAALDDFLAFIGQEWPGSDLRLTNEGVLQDEYADYVAIKLDARTPV